VNGAQPADRKGVPVPWLRFNANTPDFLDRRGDVGFLLDNDVDVAVMMPWLQGRLGLSVIELPHNLRDRSDEEVLAEARRLERILVTHDRDFLDTARFPPADNPGVVIVPGGEGADNRHLSVIGTVLLHVSELRYLYIETVLDLTTEGRITLWNHDQETGQVEPISMRVRWDEVFPVEVWFDDDERPARAPAAAWKMEIEGGDAR
jgi:predicted nuclease of predicted toxin-antitoxin system